MRNRLMGSILAVVAVLAFSPVIEAQSQQSGAARTPPDLSGIWSRPRFEPVLTEPPENGKPVIPPMQPWAAETYKAHQRSKENPEQNNFLDSQGRNRVEMALDPTWAACVPRGFPRLYFSGNSLFEIYQVPGRVIQIFEADRTARIIYTDGRGHPEGHPHSFLGHSIGHWDGDTLIVDTVGLSEAHETWLDGDGHPHTAALRVVERVRRVAQDTLEVDLLFDDPGAYTRPWGGKRVYHLRPGWEVLETRVCEERIREEIVPEVRRLIKELSKP